VARYLARIYSQCPAGSSRRDLSGITARRCSAGGSCFSGQPSLWQTAPEPTSAPQVDQRASRPRRELPHRIENDTLPVECPALDLVEVQIRLVPRRHEIRRAHPPRIGRRTLCRIGHATGIAAEERVASCVFERSCSRSGQRFAIELERATTSEIGRPRFRSTAHKSPLSLTAGHHCIVRRAGVELPIASGCSGH
jgi:hypothetical protein